MTTTLYPNQSRSYSLPAGSVINISTTGQALVENFGSGNALVSKNAVTGSYQIGPYLNRSIIKLTALSANVDISEISEYSNEIKNAKTYDQAFIVGGQSNAAGAGVLPASDYDPFPNVLLYTKNEEYEVCSEPSGRRGNNWINNVPSGISLIDPKFSFLTDFGKAVSHYAGISPVMVPCAYGSTNMTHWLPPSNEDDMSTLFGAMTARTKIVNQRLLPNNKPVFLWYGHESEAAAVTETLSTGAFGTEYISKWITLCNNIRDRFPGSPLIFAQLATHDDSTNATSLRKGAESQRLSESEYGDSTTIVGYEDSGLPVDFSENFQTANTNATNTATVENGQLHIISDGTAIPEGFCYILEPGTPYRMNVTVSGTGTWRFYNGGTIVGGTNRAANATVDIDFTPVEYPGTGFGRFRFLRGAANNAADLLITVNSIKNAYFPMIANSHMVVTHDLPRNANPDGYHINVDGLREVGRRFALAYAERVLGMTWLNGTGPRLVSVTKPSSTTVKVKFNKTIQENANGYGVNLAGSLFRVYDGGSEKTLDSCVRDPADDTAVLITVTVENAGVVVVTYGDRAGPADATWRQGVVYDSDNMPAPMFGPVIAA